MKADTTRSARRILCATDRSPASGRAWEFAQELAGALKTELVLLHVLAPSSHGETREEARTWLRRFVQGTSDPGLVVEILLVDGQPGPEILATAGREEVDLIVVGSRGHAGLGRLLLGSVAEHVVAGAVCPVASVRAIAQPRAVARTRIERILFSTDLSAASTSAWLWVQGLAGTTGAEIDVLHVVTQVAEEEPPESAFHQGAIPSRSGESTELWGGLDLGSAPSGGAASQPHVHLAHGDPAAQIVDWADSRRASLIIMGTRGRARVLRWQLGSVTRRVLQAASCPVLTVGPTATPRSGLFSGEAGARA